MQVKLNIKYKPLFLKKPYKNKEQHKRILKEILDYNDKVEKKRKGGIILTVDKKVEKSLINKDFVVKIYQ